MASDTHIDPHRFNELATKTEKWNKKARLECVSGQHPPSNTPAGVLPWTCRSEGKWPSRQTVGQSNLYKWLPSRKIWSVEELETLPSGTKPRTSHHRSPGGERRGKKEVLDDLPWKDERGPLSIRPTLEPFKGNVGETSDRQGGAYMGFSERIDTILNWTELNLVTFVFTQDCVTI